MMNIFDIQPNKVSTDLTQYPIAISGMTGDGKTDTMKRILESFAVDGKKPLFLMFEDRYKGIEGIYPVRIHSYPELKTVLQQLRNPKAKEAYSCIVIDTMQKMESMILKYTCDARNTKTLKDIGNWGKGTQEFRHDLSILEELKNVGLTLHYILQADKNVDQDTGAESFSIKLQNKNTFKAVVEESFMVGHLIKKHDEEAGEDRYFLTFKKNDRFPDLKDTWGLPQYIEYHNLKDEMLKAIQAKGAENITSETTMTHSQEEKRPFAELMDECKEVYTKLYKAGFVNDLEALRKRLLGVDEETEETRSLNDLVENQRDLVEVFIIEMNKIIDKNNIE